MNINLGNQGQSQDFQIMLNHQASPYLSPLYGSLSFLDQNLPTDLIGYELQENPFPTQIKEFTSNEDIFNPQAVLVQHEPNSEAINQDIIGKQKKEEIKVPLRILKHNQSPVYSIIQFLVMNDSQSQLELLQFGKPLYENNARLQFVFRTLLQKFKKLKKTKEEMVKYCMRKAFKYTSELHKSPKSSRSKKQKQKQKQQKLNMQAENQLSIQMPFRKNSSQKTMNSHFLQQTFKNKEFVAGYRQFLKTISHIIEEDNNSKISYLSESIEKILGNQQIKQIQTIKRLPWTKTILDRTQELAKSLMEFAHAQPNPLCQFQHP